MLCWCYNNCINIYCDITRSRSIVDCDLFLMNLWYSILWSNTNIQLSSLEINSANQIKDSRSEFQDMVYQCSHNIESRI